MIKAKQDGLSLIELLITMVLSSVIMLGVVQIYADTNRTDLFQSQQLRNLEGSRIPDILLNKYLDKAGFRRNVTRSLQETYTATNTTGPCGAFKRGSVVTNLTNNNDVGFCIRYMPSFHGERDCAGNATAITNQDITANPQADDMVILAITFAPNNDLSMGALRCQNVSNNGGLLGNSVELVMGLADIRFEFKVAAINSNGSIVQTVDRTNPNPNDIKTVNMQALSTLQDNEAVISLSYDMLIASDRSVAGGIANLLVRNWIGDGRTAQVSSNRIRADVNGGSDRIYQTLSGSRTFRALLL